MILWKNMDGLSQKRVDNFQKESMWLKPVLIVKSLISWLKPTAINLN